jgi:tripartite-type tricarboxylate transporter receptor subunit TctC
MMFDNIVAVLGHVRAGRLRPLAVSSADRSAILPEVPTVAEQGFPGFEVNAWFGLMAPAGTPRAVVDRVAAVAGEAIRNPEISGRLASEGAVVVADRPEDFGRFLEADAAKWERVARDGNIRVSE